jgi:hypothetical protein
MDNSRIGARCGLSYDGRSNIAAGLHVSSQVSCRNGS